MAPHSGNCTTCGLPIAGPTCRACGGTSRPIALADGAASAASAFAPDPARPELDLAYEAWASGDLTRVVSQCLSAEGASGVSMQQGADGPVFKALSRGLAMFIRLREGGQLQIEIPVVRLPLTHYTAALRLLLELSDRDEVPVRFSARGELVLARFVGRLGAMSPSAVCAALQATTSSASQCARLLVGALQARELTPDEHEALSVEALPTGLLLDLDGPGSSIPLRKGQGGSPFDAFNPLVGGAPQEAPPNRGAGRQTPPPRGKVPTPARIGRPTPGVLPMPGPGAKAARAPSELPAGGLVPPTAPAAQAPRSPLVPPPKAGASTAPAPQPQQAVGRTMVSADAMANTSPSHGISGFPPPPPDPLGDTFISGSAAAAAPPKTGSAAADSLCELLHKAQTLGAVLSFADQPATMCLLIRATVYRALQELDPAVNDAVALLFAETQPLIREIYITAPGKRRGSMAIPPTSPAFEVMARIVSQRCEVSGAPPLQVQPITTAQDAKQHLARYVSEIDQAPSDPDLRHFLALGALCELLVRTKLPPATQDRLRGIVAHAKKEGAKQAVVDLMMTALTRMIA